jgi:adenylate cyclase
VPLVGTWEICWNQLVEPGESCVPGWRPVPVLGAWSEPGVESPFGGKGFATYRLNVVLPQEVGPLSLAAGGALTAHRLWINGVDRGGAGVIGRSAETTIAGVSNRVYELVSESGAVEFQVQVANFAFRGGGLRRIWFLGQPDSIQRGIGLAILRDGTLFAAGLIVGFGYLTLFALRPAERARGYFGMIALGLGLRAVPASITTFGELVAPWMTWDFIVRAEYFGAAVVGFAFAGYARTKVPGIMPPRTVNIIQVVAVAFGVVVALAPMPIVLATLPVQWAYAVVLIGLIVLCYGRAWLRGVPGVGVTAVTAVLYLCVVAHDILRSIQSGVGVPIELFPYAIVLWIFAEAYQLLQGFHKSFEEVESLSEELGDANFELQETEAAIVRFVPFDFLRELGKESLRDVQSGDHARSEMSVLHCRFHPARGKTDSEDSGESFERINELIEALEPCIYRQNGFLNDYRGDGFQAFFPGGPPDAVAAAVEIRDAAREFAATGAPSGRGPIEVGMGIDTGWVQLGTIGSGEHLVRCVFGGPVERSRQIAYASNGRLGSVMISGTTRDGLGQDVWFDVQPIEGAEVGSDGSIEIFEIGEHR